MTPPLFSRPVIAALLCLCMATASARTWTSTSGSTLEAEFADYKDGKVSLKKPDGKVVTLAVRLLSEADKNFLKEELKRNPIFTLKEVALFPVKVNGSYGYIDVEGRGVIKPAYRKAEPFSQGLGLVESDHAGFISADGTPVIGVDKAGPGEAYRSFSDGVAPFRKDGKWGLIDRSGKVILKPSHADIRRFSHQRAVVRIGSQSAWGIGKRGYIDTTGKMVIEPVYNEALDFSDGVAAVNLQGVYGQWGFIDPSGKMLIEPQFHRAYSFFDGLARAMPKEGGGFGLIDKTGKYVLSKDEKKSSMGPGIEVTQTSWHSPGDFGCGVAPVHMQGALYLVNRKGKKASRKLPYGSVSQFVDGMAVYEQNGQYGYVDTSGNIVIKAAYTNAANFQNGLAKVQTKKEHAYINRRGKIVWKVPK